MKFSMSRYDYPSINSLELCVAFTNSELMSSACPKKYAYSYIENIDYKFSEDKLINDIKEYIDNTYNQHYAKTKFQATEFIVDGGHGEGFCIGNILKYAQRYGKKEGYNKNDLLKVIHYALIALHVHDLNNERSENETK